MRINKEKEDSEFVDAENFNFSGKMTLTFRDIVLRHLTRITQFASVEWRGGYWTEQAIPMKETIMTTKVYVPDSRVVYWNSVDCLHDLLLPKFDDEMKKDSEEVEEDLEKNKKHWTEKAGEDIKKYEQYYLNDKVEIKRKLIQKLNLLLSRLSYLASDTISE